MQARRAARGRPLRDEHPGWNEGSDAVAHTRRRTADAKPRLRLSAQAHQFKHSAAVRRQRLGRYDLALLRLVADIRAQRPAVSRNDRKLLDRDCRKRRLAQGVHIGDATGIDTAACQVFEGGYRAGDVRLRQRHVPLRRQLKLRPALTLDRTVQAKCSAPPPAVLPGPRRYQSLRATCASATPKPHTQPSAQVERAALR